MPEFDFSTLITDRSRADLQVLRDVLSTPMEDWTAEQLAVFNQAASKGAYNYTDLNRVTACMDYLNERLTALGYVTGYQPIIVHPETPPPTPTIPEGYTELEYIQSSGTQYINTSVIPNNETSIAIDIDALTQSGWYGVFGSRGNPLTANAFALFQTATTGLLQDQYGAQLQGSVSGVIYGRHIIEKIGPLTKIDGETVNSFSDIPFTGQASMALLNSMSPSGVESFFMSAKLYSCKISNNGSLVRDYIPCKRPDGEIGLYDTVNELFYGNSGTGAFTAGPEIPPPEPEPTLEPYTWYETDIPTYSQMQRYIANGTALRNALTLPETTAKFPSDMAGLTQQEANTIESVLGIIGEWINNMMAAWFYSGDLYAGEV